MQKKTLADYLNELDVEDIHMIELWIMIGKYYVLGIVNNEDEFWHKEVPALKNELESREESIDNIKASIIENNMLYDYLKKYTKIMHIDYRVGYDIEF